LETVPVGAGLEAVAASPDTLLVLGIARCKWTLLPKCEDAVEYHRVVCPPGCEAVADALGFVQYEVVDLYLLPEPVLFQNGQKANWRATCMRSCGDLRLEGLGVIKNVLNGVERETSLHMPVAVTTSLLLGDLSVVKSVVLKRAVRYDGVIIPFPAKSNIRHHWNRWRKDAQAAGVAEPIAEEDAAPRARHPLLRHPGKRGAYDTEELKRPFKFSKHDPIKLLRALSFGHLLRDEGKFSEAMGRSRKFEQDPSDDEAQPRDPKGDPSRSTRQRARHRADVVVMLLERREFREWYENDLIESIYIYSDGSPVVGMELQGNLLDVKLTTGEWFRRTFPGATLPYGTCDVVSKCITLLWGFFLTAGPDEEILRYACSKVSCLTTDGGTEIGLVETPDLLRAFYRWMDGAELIDLRALVDQSSRLFPNSIRIIGFGHTCGGIMKTACESYEDWPSILDKCRSIVWLYRNRSYRDHLQTKLKHRVDVRCLDHFEANFIKWRYETIATVFWNCVKVRTISEHHVREELFAEVQDRKKLQQAVSACRDKKFWRFVAAADKFVVRRCEGLRHWSMVCDCEEHRNMRHDGKGDLVVCDVGSRRMLQGVDLVKKRGC